MGCAHDIYEAKVPVYLDGCLSFSTLALILYQECGILLLAVTGRNHLDMRLFPSRILVKRSHYIYLLATNPDAVNQVESLALSTLQKHETRIPNFAKIAERWHANSMAGKIRTTMRASVSSLVPVAMSMRSASSFRESAATSETTQEDLPRRRSQLLGSYRAATPDVTAKSSRDDGSPLSHRRGSVTRVLPYNDNDTANHVDHFLQPDNAPPTHAESSVLSTSDLSRLSIHALASPSPPDQPTHSQANQLFQKLSSQRAYATGQGGPPPDPIMEDIGHPAFAPRMSASTRHTKLFESFLDQNLPSDLSDHIILCGMPNAVHDFVAPLRHQLDSHAKSTQFLGSSQHAMTATPIIIISEIPLTEKQHASIAMFQKVYFLCGSPLQEGVLRQASAFTAKSIVILGSCLQAPGQYDDDYDDEDGVAADTKDQNMLDTDAITLHRYVVECCECNCPAESPMATVIVELSRPSSLRFLKDDLVRSENPSTLEAVKTLTKRVLSRADDPLDNICHPIYAAGIERNVFISNSLDAVLGNCNKYGCIIDLLHLLTFGEGATNEYGRVLDQIAVPIIYHNKSYLECFVQMLVTQVYITILFEIE
ncbi:hypothetical protein B5M09_005806 [Aphanomyces astaci]|uniref:RCK N-terminal domain-containing protein n=1 Tax=Aphanomyces astaci TaxID=112090 RepID=A0A425CT04_APHAT|nr:hypothetical protein B5M09_005806 [Aphanomyces astaci]